jgi:predicted membrane channel-forming protein YqfA (hemolysin III family)
MYGRENQAFDTPEALVRKLTLYVMGFAVAHVLISVILTIVTFGAVMQGFDRRPAAPPRLVAFLMTTVDVLNWPMRYLARPTMSGAMQYAVLYANGLLWAIAAVCVYRAVRRRRSRRFPPATGAA